MKRIIELDGRTIEYDLERKNVKNLNLRIKRSMLFPRRNRFLQNRIFVRRRIIY